MPNRKESYHRLEKPKEASGSAISRFIRRLSPTKKYHGHPTPGTSSRSPTFQEETSYSQKKDASVAKDASHKSSEKPSKMALNQSSESISSKSTLSSLSGSSTWMTPALSYQSLNRDDKATELKLLTQLHCNFNEATNALEKYVTLRSRKK